MKYSLYLHNREFAIKWVHDYSKINFESTEIILDGLYEQIENDILNQLEIQLHRYISRFL